MAPPTTPEQLAGRTVRMIRQVHGVSLRSLARIVGISPSHLSRVEQGQRAVSPDLALRICQALAALPVPPGFTADFDTESVA
jgi:transcriptional regulator with XRE-family HTH domain